jgi:CCR4-NOT transcription complex subunit 1
MLKQFKNSSNSQEREIFTCMINNLFEEYQFFHKYPEKVGGGHRQAVHASAAVAAASCCGHSCVLSLCRVLTQELKISGLLFGNIIQHQLVVTTTLGVALR